MVQHLMAQNLTRTTRSATCSQLKNSTCVTMRILGSHLLPCTQTAFPQLVCSGSIFHCLGPFSHHFRSTSPRVMSQKHNPERYWHRLVDHLERCIGFEVSNIKQAINDRYLKKCTSKRLSLSNSSDHDDNGTRVTQGGELLRYPIVYCLHWYLAQNLWLSMYFGSNPLI